MRRTWRDQRVNRKIVLVGGFVTAMVGAHGFAWSAGDPHAPRLRMRRRHPPCHPTPMGQGLRTGGEEGARGGRPVPRM